MNFPKFYRGKEVREPLSFRLPPLLIERLKNTSKRLGAAPTDVVEAALIAYLDKTEQKGQNK